MKNLNNFAAIDFEIANANRSSVCSVGVVVVRDREIVEQFYSLIKPQPNYYHYRFTDIHGLSRADTDNAPLFPEVWQYIAPKIEDLPLVTHNAPFDKSCLLATLEFFDMQHKQFDFYCTCKASRNYFKTLPVSMRPSKTTLDYVSNFFDIQLDNHHNAIADALACAEIALCLQKV